MVYICCIIYGVYGVYDVHIYGVYGDQTWTCHRHNQGEDEDNTLYMPTMTVHSWIMSMSKNELVGKICS